MCSLNILTTKTTILRMGVGFSGLLVPSNGTPKSTVLL